MRQYVGARYVPKFADPFEWNAQMVYEPLTIVGYLGSSYTSRKQVPAGTLPTDNEYWALTGNLNGSVAEVQKQLAELTKTVNDNATDLQTNIDQLANKEASDVSNLQSAINSNNNKIINIQQEINKLHVDYDGQKIVVFGDSLTAGSNSQGYEWTKPTWFDRWKQLLPSTAQAISYAVPSGTLTTVAPNLSVVNIMKAREVDAEVDKVIIFAGTNDTNRPVPFGSWTDTADPSTFCGALRTIYNTARTKYPNAKYYIVTIPHRQKEQSDAHVTLVYNRLIRVAAAKYGMEVISGECFPLLANVSTVYTQYQPDGLHYNQNYTPILAEWMYHQLIAPGNREVSEGNYVRNMPADTPIPLEFTREPNDEYIYTPVAGKYRIRNDGTIYFEITINITKITAIEGSRIVEMGNLPDFLVPTELTRLYPSPIREGTLEGLGLGFGTNGKFWFTIPETITLQQPTDCTWFGFISSNILTPKMIY